MLTLPRVTARLLVIVPFAALLFAACEHNDETVGPPPAGQLASIVVTPNPVTLAPNSDQQFVATGTDINGAVIAVVPTWAIVASGGAINTASGLFTAGAPTGTFNSTVRACNPTGVLCGFATVTVVVTAPVGPSLGTAASYGILAGSAITCAGTNSSRVNADVAISPAAGSNITGFPPCVITGVTNTPTTGAPPGAAAAQAQSDALRAYNALVAMACGTTIGTADQGGKTLAPGVYCSPTSVLVNSPVTLDGQGNANALFVIQAGTTLTTGGVASPVIRLINGAQAKNVWWQVGTSATIGTNNRFQGNIVAFTTITLSGADTLIGRALALNGAVSLSATSDVIILP